MITDKLILQLSGQYDKEIIHRLNLSKQGLKEISNLDQCRSLTDLSLANNQITDISGLDQLYGLRRLDLSHNNIRKIEGLANLGGLEWLDLRGNRIASVENLNELAKLMGLKHLYLQDLDGEKSNPVCGNPSYAAIVRRVLPHLETIDGGHLSITDSFSTVEEHLQSLQPEESSCRTPPIQPWFTAEQLVVNEINLDDYDTNSGSSAKNKNIAALESVQATIHTISEMLQEECSMLLRKSTQAINKTK